jgi:peptide/nickel transport system ATP-binding protein
VNASAPAGPTLDVQGLSISYQVREGRLKAVRDVSFQIAPGEAYGLIGESGSGKSSIAYATMRYLHGAAVSGRILLGNRDVMQMSPAELMAARGRVAAMVYQDPMSSLNPAIKVGEQIAEVIRQHRGQGKREAWRRSVELLAMVHLPLPQEMAHRYPHQLSGGQQQRIVIAMALAGEPRLLIMDEPTTGLDVTTESVILALINELRRVVHVAVLFISHNVSVVAQVCDRVGVLYAGQLVEEGSTQHVLRSPRHPYTIGLMAALPTLATSGRRLNAIPGRLPDLRWVPDGCVFNSRCGSASDHPCRGVMPALRVVAPAHHSRCHFDQETVATRLAGAADKEVTEPAAILPAARRTSSERRGQLEIVAVRKTFGARRVLPFGRGRTAVVAVDDATLVVPPGGTLAVVGESGSGKTTLARCVAGLILPDAGDIRLENVVLAPDVGRRSRAQQQAVQIVFQNPDAALNPQWTVEQIVARPLRLYDGLRDHTALRHQVIALLETVKLGERYLSRYPHEISGGEKQRVSIARAFASRPRMVICDEPTSALDVSVQAAILNELLALQEQHGTSYLFISHDLGVVRHVADQVAIMQRGKIVEIGDPAQVFDHPAHPYTRALIAAIPKLEAPSRPAAVRLERAATDHVA